MAKGKRRGHLRPVTHPFASGPGGSRVSRLRLSAFCLTSFILAAPASGQQRAALPTAKLDAFKREAIADVDGRGRFTQQMVDQIFSFGELGFQEVETSKYLVKILRDNGFTVEEGIAGIPTSWVATWGSGKPVIAVGSDIDGIPQA